MNTMIKATNIELTNTIQEYVDKRMESVSRVLNDTDAVVRFEVAKTTNHHKQGELFQAEVSIVSNGNKFFSRSVQEDLYAAIDDVKEEITREITYFKDKKETLFRRGARSVKKMFKGISDRNPFTSK